MSPALPAVKRHTLSQQETRAQLPSPYNNVSALFESQIVTVSDFYFCRISMMRWRLQLDFFWVTRYDNRTKPKCSMYVNTSCTSLGRALCRKVKYDFVSSCSWHVAVHFLSATTRFFSAACAVLQYAMKWRSCQLSHGSPGAQSLLDFFCTCDVLRCYTIWTAAGITQEQLAADNPGLDCSNLQIGQVTKQKDTLCQRTTTAPLVPAPATGMACVENSPAPPPPPNESLRSY